MGKAEVELFTNLGLHLADAKIDPASCEGFTGSNETWARIPPPASSLPDLFSGDVPALYVVWRRRLHHMDS